MFKLLKRVKCSLVYPANNTFDLLFNIRIDLLIFMCSQVSYDIYYYTIFLRFHSIANLVYCYARFEHFAWVSWDSLRTALFNCDFDFLFRFAFHDISSSSLSVFLYFRLAWSVSQVASQHFTNVRKFFPFFPSFNLLFPFLAQSIIMFFANHANTLWLCLKLINFAWEKKKNFPKNCSTQEFNSINKTENGKIASRKRKAGQEQGHCLAASMGTGSGPAGSSSGVWWRWRFEVLFFLLYAWIIENLKWFLNGRTDSCQGRSQLATF